VQTADLHEISDLQAYVEDAFLRYSRVIAEFRANKGEVGGQFQGAPLLLIHHRHRETGKEYVAPIFYLASDEEDVIYVFATLGGGLTDPNWYKNVIAAGSAVVEVGAEVYPVSATEVTGEQRDLVYAEQTRRYPVFGEYERLNAGVRVIPVVALRRG
jgi:deazaflavin-dependent oxidoreductase (nitroreductase family)